MKISKENQQAGRIGRRIMDAINCSQEEAKKHIPAVVSLIDEAWSMDRAIAKVLNEAGYHDVQPHHCN